MKAIKYALFSTLIGFSINTHAGEICEPSCYSVCESKCGYIFGYGGVSFTDIEGRSNGGNDFSFDTDAGFIAGGGAGLYTNLLGGSRFEIEGLYTETDINAINGVNVIGDTSVTAVMINLLKEIPLGCTVGYLGGGLGYGNVEVSDDTDTIEDSALAYQFIAGIDLPISECLALFTQYKLLGVSETEFGGDRLDSFFTHSVSAGLRVSF